MVHRPDDKWNVDKEGRCSFKDRFGEQMAQGDLSEVPEFGASSRRTRTRMNLCLGVRLRLFYHPVKMQITITRSVVELASLLLQGTRKITAASTHSLHLSSDDRYFVAYGRGYNLLSSPSRI